MAEEEDRVHIGKAWSAAGRLTRRHERRFGDDRGVRPYICVVDTGFIAKPLHYSQCMRDGIVLTDAVTRVCPRKDDLFIRALSCRRSACATSLGTCKGANQSGGSECKCDSSRKHI